MYRHCRQSCLWTDVSLFRTRDLGRTFPIGSSSDDNNAYCQLISEIKQSKISSIMSPVKRTGITLTFGTTWLPHFVPYAALEVRAAVTQLCGICPAWTTLNENLISIALNKYVASKSARRLWHCSRRTYYYPDRTTARKYDYATNQVPLQTVSWAHSGYKSPKNWFRWFGDPPKRPDFKMLRDLPIDSLRPLQELINDEQSRVAYQEGRETGEKSASRTFETLIILPQALFTSLEWLKVADVMANTPVEMYSISKDLLSRDGLEKFDTKHTLDTIPIARAALAHQLFEVRVQ